MSGLATWFEIVEFGLSKVGARTGAGEKGESSVVEPWPISCGSKESGAGVACLRFATVSSIW